MQYVYAGLAGLAAATASYGVTNAKDVWAKVRSFVPSNPLAKTPTNDLDEILAAIRKAQVKSLDKPCAVRTPVLTECDSFAATVRNLYAAEDAA